MSKEVKHKFRVGGPFPNVESLIEWVLLDRWVYWRGKIKHPEIVKSQQLRVLVEGYQWFRRAEKNEP